MSSDRYTKLVLTLIALALWGLLLRDLFPMRAAFAKEGELSNVNLAQIAGVPLSPGPIEVQLKQPIRVEGGNETPVMTVQVLNVPGPKK